MDELVLFVAFLLPGGDGGRQTGINDHLDQLATRVFAGKKFAQLEPIEAAPDRPHGTESGFAEVHLIAILKRAQQFDTIERTEPEVGIETRIRR